MKITIQDGEREVSAVIPSDADIQELGEAIKGLIVSFGYHPDNVDSLFNLERWDGKENP
jgi:hypothetical protein